MDYIVFDLEWNQCPSGKKKENGKLPFEIIEIGAIKYNSKKKYVDTFHALIKPQVYHSLHFQIRKVVSLTMKDLEKKGEYFPVVAQRFLEWCGDDYRFCTWGPGDLKELQRNLQFYHIPLEFEKPLVFYDIQKLYSIAYEDGKTRRSLENVVERMGVKKKGSFHNALNDARYTGVVLEHLESSLIQSHYSIDTYIPPETKKDEIYAVFPTYSKYISRCFATKEELMADREVTSSRCYVCGKPARKRIRWFSAGSRLYICQAYCEHHGYLRGKIRLKTAENGMVYGVKTLKLIGEEDAAKIKKKQEEIRKKRRLKRQAAASTES